ncbi:MAG TPA: hypothetical protein PLS49_02985 [Candidatus Woesebacteria bacterium]|nr:hypothetical protein [Candidatus Woesebacteria bacterium]
MEQTHSQSTQTHSDLGLETLFKAAFKRTKERFLTYFLTYVLSIFIFIGVLIAIGIVVGINILVGIAAQSEIVSVSIGFISGIAILGVLIYAGCWTSLAYLYALISPQKIGVMEVYKTVRPLVWPYFKVSVITTLFMIGLLPFGIITLGILLILWGIWGMFMLFVFLDKKETGLHNLFISKAIVSSKFWGIVFRALMIYGAYMVIIFLLGSASGNKHSGGISAVLIPLVGIFAGPFITSYFYEMYKRLPSPKEVSSNTFWIILSVIGWLLSIGLSIVFFSSVLNGVQNAIKDPDFKKNLQMIEEDSKKMDKSGDYNKDMKELEMELEKLMESGTTDEI